MSSSPPRPLCIRLALPVFHVVSWWRLKFNAPSIKKGDCSDAWKFVSHHCANRSSQIKGIGFDQSYSPVAHSDLFIINIAIADMHKLTVNILDVSNEFQNTNIPIYERFCVSPSPYYLDWLEVSYPNIIINSRLWSILYSMNEWDSSNKTIWVTVE